MAADTTSEKCFELSLGVLALFGDIEERAEARMLAEMLTEQASALGAAVNAFNYMPLPQMRAVQAAELIRCSQQVIYTLNLARRAALFEDKKLARLLAVAVSAARDIGAMAARPEGFPPSAPAAGGMPDGLDMPY